MYFLGGQRLVADRAGHHRIEGVAAILVLVEHRSAALIRHVNVTPVDDRHHDRMQVQPLLGQDVLVALRTLLIGHAPKHALAHEFLETLGQQMPCDAEARLKSSNRRMRRKQSRKISSVQRSPMTDTVRATEQASSSRDSHFISQLRDDRPSIPI